jgi:transcriptional regulator with XRE-family HTH domain
MDMESYRKANRLTYKRLVEKLHLDGMPVSRARRIALGQIWPRPRVLKAIVKGSDCEITVNSMFERYAAQQEIEEQRAA